MFSTGDWFHRFSLSPSPTRQPKNYAAEFASVAWQDRWRSLDADEQAVQLGRLQLALRSLDEAAISTIHSFCQRSLQEHALAGNQM